MKRKSCLIISMHYRPEQNFIVSDVAEAFIASGIRTTVLTAHPNYPFGKFFEGVKWWWPSFENIAGVRVVRIPHFPDHSQSILRRVFCYLSFCVLGMLVAPFICFKPSAVWVYQTPFSNALAALYFKLAYRSKLIFMYADLWPESFLATNVVRNRAVIAACHYYRKTVNRMADVIIGSTQGTCEKISLEIRSAAPCKLIPVWVEGIPEELPPVVSGRQKEIVYAGNLGKAQALGTVIEGARILAQSHPELKFTIMGAGTEEDRLRQIVESESLKNVRFIGRRSASIAFDALARAEAQIVILEKNDLFNFTVPSKLFMSLAVGTPILAGLQGEALRLATDTGAAIPFDSDSPSSFADAVKILYDKTPAEREKMANLARISYQNNFIPRRLIAQHAEILKNLI